MKTTKKILVLCLIAVMAMVAVMPSTFSWYAHSGETNYDGNAAQYTRSDLPLSVQRSANSSELSMETYKADKFGKKTGNALSSFDSISHGTTQRYITTISNSDTTHDFYLDLEMSNISNNANVYVGTCSPVVNEKSYASRATTSLVDWDYEIIYFEPRTHYDWWKQGVNYNAPTNAYGGGISYSDDNNTVSPTNDMNLCYSIGGSGKYMPMQKCPTGDTVDSTTYDVYRAFVTSEADDMFFFNHYYVTEDTNKEWNRTPSFSDFAEGRVYYLNGGTNSYNNKDLSYHDSFNETNLCVYRYYSTATMAIGKTANISLNKGTSENIAEGEEFDYTGKSVSYSVTENNPTTSGNTVCTVSQDGLITAKAAGTATVTTTITGEFDDTITLETKVNVPSTISQVPIVQNIKVPAGKSVDVVWYVKNSDSSNSSSFSNIFYTI